MFYRASSLSVFLLLLPTLVLAQTDTLSNLLNLRVVVKENPIFTSTKTIIPSTVVLINQETGQEIKAFSIDNNSLYLDSIALYQNDTISIELRTFTFNIGQEYFRIDSSQMQLRDKVIYIGYDYRPFRNNENALFASKDLNYNGSISRGFSVGNSQSLALNSNFNLQLSGEIGDDINIVAAISDENIPIQPEGNTQILQEFDRVFIKVSKNETSVIAGDFNLLNPEGYFQRYNKRLQGLSVANTSKLKNSLKLTNKVSASAARGKFARQTLTIQEGNQGPYKLQGNNGERFLIIQSGSERVYQDGILLERGFENDYTIDYNRAEITFTPTRLMTKDYRIVVEFEYSDQSYLRTVYASRTELSGEKFNTYLNFYSEQDSETATGNITLDSTDLQVLALAGDDSRASVRSGIRTIDPNSSNVRDRIRYKIELVNGDSVLVYSTDPEVALYTAVFSEVVPGEGDYEIADDLGVNGRVYRYVGPGNGSYIPDFQLIPPEQLRMISWGGSYELNKAASIRTELSMSQFDKNKLSNLDDQDNTGFAGFINYNHNWILKPESNWKLQTDLKAEIIDKDFNILNPYRDQEFVRDWNVFNTTKRENEQLYKANIRLYQGSEVSIDYQYSGFRRSDTYTGNKHLSRFIIKKQSFELDATGNLLLSEDENLRTSFFRPKFFIAKTFTRLKNWSTSLYSEIEYNRVEERATEVLSSNSFYYDLTRFTIKSPQGTSYRFAFNATLRRDKRPENNRFIDTNQGTTIELENQWTINPNNALQWSVAARNLTVERPDLSLSDPKTTLLGKVDYTTSLWDGTVRSTSAYNLDSGQEPKLEFVYFRLENADLGDYIYLGDDDQGLDESLFQYSPGNPMAFYQRTSQFNNEFILTNNQTFNQSLRIDFRNLWKPKTASGRSQRLNKTAKRKKWQNFVRRFSSITNIRLTQKVMDDAGDAGIQFSNFDLADTNLISGTRLVNHTLFFNKGNPLYDLQLGRKRADNKLVQISGFELRGNLSTFARLRWNIKKYIDFITLIEKGARIGDSEQFDNRDFDIDYYSFNPKINYRPTANLRLSTEYRYADSKQNIRDLEEAITQELTLGFSLRKASTESLDFSLSYVDIDYKGMPNTVVEFELLDGLKDGRNMLWSVNYIRRLNNSIDLNINYEGRKTGESPVFNVARAQVKATF